MKNAEKEPATTLPEILEELAIINGKVFQLKQGMKMLVDLIESGATAENLKKVVELFKIKETLTSLEAKC